MPKDCTCEQQQNTRLPSRVDKRSVFQNTLGLPMGSSGFGGRSLGESKGCFTGMDVFLGGRGGDVFWPPFLWGLSPSFLNWGGFLLCFTSEPSPFFLNKNMCRLFNAHSSFLPSFWTRQKKNRYFDGLPHSARIQFGCLEFAMPIWHLVWKKSEFNGKMCRLQIQFCLLN